MDDRFELLLMRHGEAEDYAEGGDARRPLSAAGHADTRAMGTALRAMGLVPHAVVASPLLRAQQTARNVVDGIGTSLDPIATDGQLVPSATPSSTIAMLHAHVQSLGQRGMARLLAVGHNPSVTSTVGQYVCGGPALAFNVAPGDLAHLHVQMRDGRARGVVLGFYPAASIVALRGDG
ncbi:MAG: histidine phosphatase family protein [Myxococcota bacterium]